MHAHFSEYLSDIVRITALIKGKSEPVSKSLLAQLLPIVTTQSFKVSSFNQHTLIATVLRIKVLIAHKRLKSRLSVELNLVLCFSCTEASRMDFQNGPYLQLLKPEMQTQPLSLCIF